MGHRKLTKEQDCIANHHQGHARVAAVAGSGKTENMIELVWRTVSRGTPPGRILVILFNRDATNDFDVRLTRRFSQEEVNRESLRVRTFHALGKSICELFEKKKLLRNKSLETRGWVMDSMAKATLKEAVGRVTNRFQGDSADLKDEFTSFIDIVKADILPAEDVFDKTSVQPTLKSLFLQAFALFEEERERQNIRFFADLIADPVYLMYHQPKMREFIEDRVDLIICDEAQDMNPVQQKLVEYIAGTRANVVAVGDIDQCIYEWRGADPRHLLTEFSRHYHPVTNYQLSHTFRYGHKLSLMANHLIQHNLLREDTFCVSHESCPKTDVSLRWQRHDKLGRSVMQQIADQWIEDGNDWGDLAVLVRDNASATGLILELLSRDTPFNLKGNIEFLGNAPYADALLGLLHLLNGSLFNPEQKKRLVSLLRFPYTRIPTKTWKQVADRCIKTYSLEPAIKAVQNAGLHDYATTRQIERLKWLAHSSHTEYRTLTDRFPDGAGGVQAAILQRYIADGVADYKAAFSWMATNEQMADRYARVVKEIIDFVNRIDKPLDELLVQFDSFEEKIRQNDNGITISTCHSAKGLQYDGVVLYGLEQGVFPNERAPIEEERRLFYVAMTRARRHLFLVAPKDNDLKDALKEKQVRKIGGPKGGASQFLYEIALPLCEEVAQCLYENKPDDIAHIGPVADARVVNRYLDAVASGSPRLEESAELRKAASHSGALKPGDMVRINHRKYGEGRITAWRGDEYIQVQFNNLAGSGWYKVDCTPFELI